MANAKEYRDLSAEELEATYLDASKELFDLRNDQKLTKRNEQPHLIKERKRSIARMLTVLGEKRRGAEAQG